MDISAWLRDLRLERYAASFEANAIDSEVLLELAEADLEKLGVILGHRKKLLRRSPLFESRTRKSGDQERLTLQERRVARPSGGS
jgi:hypothetical protein